MRRLRCAPALGIAEALHRVLPLAGARITRCPALARRPLQPQSQTSLARSGWCCLALRCAPVKVPNSAADAAPCVMTHAPHYDTAGNPIYLVDIHSDIPASMCRLTGHHETLHHGKPAEMDIGVSHGASMMRRPPHITCRRGCIFSSTAAEICSVHAAVFAAPMAPSSA